MLRRRIAYEIKKLKSVNKVPIESLYAISTHGKNVFVPSRSPSHDISTMSWLVQFWPLEKHIRFNYFETMSSPGKKRILQNEVDLIW